MKKQHIHRFVLIMLVLLFSIQLCACGNSEPTIVGHWQGEFRFEYRSTFWNSREYGDELYIYEDGTFRIDGEAGESDGRYELLYDGQSITFNFGDCEYGPYDFWFEDKDRLTIITDEMICNLKRVS